MIVKALLLGFSASFWCLGYCFIVAGPLMLSRTQHSIKHTLYALSLFIAGRFIAYVLFGFMVGLLSAYIKDFLLFHNHVAPVLFILLGAMMVIYGLFETFPILQKRCVGGNLPSSDKYLFFIGFLTGVNLCPPFLLAITCSLKTGSVIKSIVFFIFFFVATTVSMIPFIFSGFVSRFKDVRVAARIVAVIAGAWFIYRAAVGFTR
jgi:sulfite exporter TauE/SafE